MSFDPNTPLPADRKVRTSKRLWSDLVGEAEAEAGITAPKSQEPGYRWSNGRTFRSGKGAADGSHD